MKARRPPKASAPAVSEEQRKNKYAKALAMFRDALEIDPNNALASRSIMLIEDTYRSMGRSVPETLLRPEFGHPGGFSRLVAV